MSLPYSPTGHTDCDAALGVVVHQDGGSPVRLPVIDDGLQLYERKVGPTAITRRAEVTVPIEGFGDDNWLSYIGAFESATGGGDRIAGPTSSTGIPVAGDTNAAPTMQIADVIGQPIGGDGEPLGSPTVLFRGYVAAVGSRDGVNRAQFRIHDPSTFLSSIVAGVTFNEASYRDVLTYIRDRFVAEQPVFSEISISGEFADARPATEMLDLRDLIQVFVDPTTQLESSEPSSRELVTQREQTFSTNRDTLTDVLTWFIERTGGRVWFQPTGARGITLTTTTDNSQQYDLTPNSETLPRVIKNDALAEIAPFNAITLNGKVGKRLEVGSLGVTVPVGETYPEATATYPPLVERYGDEFGRKENSDITETSALEREAKSRLKELLDSVSGGEMVTTLAPLLRPFDRLDATPACSGISVDVDPLTYEIQEAVHSITPNDTNLPRTTLSVSLGIDAAKISTDSTVKDAQTGGEPSDTNPNEQYEWGIGPGSP